MHLCLPVPRFATILNPSDDPAFQLETHGTPRYPVCSLRVRSCHRRKVTWACYGEMSVLRHNTTVDSRAYLELERRILQKSKFELARFGNTNLCGPPSRTVFRENLGIEKTDPRHCVSGASNCSGITNQASIKHEQRFRLHRLRSKAPVESGPAGVQFYVIAYLWIPAWNPLIP